MPDPLTPEELDIWFKWAGATLLALPTSSPYPREPTACWPDYVRSKHEAYGYNAATQRAPIPNSKQITLMDQLFTLISLEPDPIIRQILHKRALVTPVAFKQIYGWTKLAKLLHSDRRAVARLHHKGLVAIIAAMPEAKIDTYRAHFQRFGS